MTPRLSFLNLHLQRYVLSTMRAESRAYVTKVVYLFNHKDTDRSVVHPRSNSTYVTSWLDSKVRNNAT